MRTIEAAGKVLAEGIADIILVGDKEDIISRAGDIDLSRASFVDPENYDKFDEYVDAFVGDEKKEGHDTGESQGTAFDKSVIFRMYDG